MFPSISPRAKALAFTFGGCESLYRDHDGSRVLADVEGQGTFRIESQLPLSVIVDDEASGLFQGSFERSLLVTTVHPGPCRVDVLQGMPEPVEGPIETGREFAGCGYILAAERLTQLDGENAAPKDPTFPIPFLFGVSGSGLKVVRSGQHLDLISSFDVSDADAMKTLGWKVQNVSKLFPIDSCLPDGTPMTGSVLSHLNAASWTVPLPPECKGLVLRKLYDAFHGRQRVRVLVDGEVAGWWYEPWQDRKCRWRWARFGIPSALVKGKGTATITIDPPAGAPLWSVGRMEIWALVDGLADGD